MEKSTTYCKVCNSSQNIDIYKSLIKCSNCGFVWANLDIPKNQIKEIYNDNYFNGGEYVNYTDERFALEKTFERNIKILINYITKGKLLELGCAYGFFLEKARKYYEVSGIEINETACNYAREHLKLDIMCGEFLETNLPENNYDIIVAWATLEHLREPYLYTQKIYKLLKKGGIFACSTPDIGSIPARIRKDKWRQIHLPTHISYFSKKSLTFLLNKCDFDVLSMSRLGEYRSINNMLYGILVLRHKLDNIYSLIKRLNLNKGYIYLNTLDTIYTIAKKR